MIINARGSHYGVSEIMLPFGGITRIRFNGYDLNRLSCRYPRVISLQI